jgi:ABC-type bacteriocin/lantibiotic exporter with double-glycine peptidase domain
MLAQFNGVARKRFKADFTDDLQRCHLPVTLLSVVLFLMVGAYQVMNGRLSIGGLVAFNSLVALANAPLSRCSPCGTIFSRPQST